VSDAEVEIDEIRKEPEQEKVIETIEEPTEVLSQPPKEGEEEAIEEDKREIHLYKFPAPDSPAAEEPINSSNF